VAVQTIKAVARGPWAANMARGQTTWYQPLEAEDDIRLAVRWVLARAGLFLNSVGDVDILPAVLRAANEPGPAPSESDMVELAKRCDLTTIFGL
ncbi:MAG: hypothetical protein WBD13_23070, partial [Burkholderiaceae bacterium]